MQEELLLSVFKKRFSIRIFFIKDFLLLINFSRRITPAYAGKTSHCRTFAPFFKDHPRVCGKDPKNYNRRDYHQGSPPRMRERLDALPAPVQRAGITPAYAGKTLIARRLKH